MLCVTLCHRVPLVKVEWLLTVSQFSDMMQVTLIVTLVATTQ